MWPLINISKGIQFFFQSLKPIIGGIFLIFSIVSCDRAPNLTIDVEPIEGGKATYLPLAPKSAGEKAQVKIVLRLRITNNESNTVTVNDIDFAFPGSSVATIDMKEEKRVLNPDNDDPGTGQIKSMQKATWSNGRVVFDDTSISNVVYLPAPAPKQIKVEVRCDGYTQPATITLDLIPYTNPTGEGAFIFPISPADLKNSEYATTSAVHWANGGANGVQIFAHDIGVQGKDPDSGKMNGLLPGKSGDKNEDFRIWRKPLRAMADGEVVDWFDGMDSNTVLGEFPDPTPNPVSGNSFLIKHGDVRVRYAHLIKGTLPKDLMVKGAKVKAGQKIGLIGNSGNSTNPHTHIHCLLHSGTRSLRGMPFKNAWVLELANHNPPANNDPWQKVSAQGIPKESVAIWPGSLWPGNLIPTAGISRSGDWANSYWISPNRQSFEQKAQELFDKQGRRLIHVATFEENGKRRWAGISRAGNWANSFWVSKSLSDFQKTAQDLFDNKGRRLIHASTFVENGQRFWVGISRGGNWASRFWVSPNFQSFKKKSQELFDKDGLRLIWVETFVENGQRKWVGISRSGNWANSFWVSPDFQSFRQTSQDLFDNKGRRLVHVSTYLENGKRKWIGISRSGNWANSFWVSPHLDHFNKTAQDLFDEKGRRLIGLEFLTNESGE